MHLRKAAAEQLWHDVCNKKDSLKRFTLLNAALQPATRI